MSITRRHLLAALTASTLLAMPGVAQAVETVRIGLPTKTYWPTTIAETAVRQKLFEKEGIAAELTIYRGGAETFEAMAAGAADVILDATSLPAAGRKKGVMSKVVANAAIVPAGTGGAINVFATDRTDLIIDVNGYFAAPGAANALWFSLVTPCRASDTRLPPGTFGAPSMSCVLNKRPLRSGICIA